MNSKLSEELQLTLKSGKTNPQFPAAVLTNLGYPLSLGINLNKNVIHSYSENGYDLSFVANDKYSIYIVRKSPNDDVVYSSRDIEKKIDVKYDIPAIFLFLRDDEYPYVVLKFDSHIFFDSYQELRSIEWDDIDITSFIKYQANPELDFFSLVTEDEKPEILMALDKARVRKFFMTEDMLNLIGSESSHEKFNEIPNIMQELLFNSPFYQEPVEDTKSEDSDEVVAPTEIPVTSDESSTPDLAMPSFGETNNSDADEDKTDSGELPQRSRIPDYGDDEEDDEESTELPSGLGSRVTEEPKPENKDYDPWAGLTDQ